MWLFISKNKVWLTTNKPEGEENHIYVSPFKLDKIGVSNSKNVHRSTQKQFPLFSNGSFHRKWETSQWKTKDILSSTDDNQSWVKAAFSASCYQVELWLEVLKFLPSCSANTPEERTRTHKARSNIKITLLDQNKQPPRLAFCIIW